MTHLERTAAGASLSSHCYAREDVARREAKLQKQLDFVLSDRDANYGMYCTLYYLCDACYD